MLRLLLEYTRLMADDRDSWSFGLDIIQNDLAGEVEIEELK
jgi:hypothetical protein